MLPGTPVGEGRGRCEVGVLGVGYGALVLALV